MIYISYTFQDCYSVVSPLQAYFLPNHSNGEASVLGTCTIKKYHYIQTNIIYRFPTPYSPKSTEVVHNVAFACGCAFLHATHSRDFSHQIVRIW
jgi:hypothetical protein